MSGNKENLLPQEGTGCAGESLSGSKDSDCPAYSGGGNFHSQGNIPEPTTTSKRNTDIEISSQHESTTEKETVSSIGNSRDETAHEIVAPDAKMGRGILRSKRPHEGPDEVPEPERAPKVSTARRGRKTGTPGVCLTYTKARSRLREPEILTSEAEADTDASLSLTDPVTRQQTSRTARKTRGKSLMVPAEKAPSSREEIIESTRQGVEKILQEAAKSGNLKGTVWGEIKRASHKISKAMDSLELYSTDDETRRLMADNKRMRGELTAMRAEMVALRTAFNERTNLASPQGLENVVEGLKKTLLVSLGTMINVRLGEIEKRLPPEPVLRPPLAADRRSKSPTSPIIGQSIRKKRNPPATTAPAENFLTFAAKTFTAAAAAKKRNAAAQSVTQRQELTPTVAPTPTTEWTEVRRKRKRKKPKKTHQPAASIKTPMRAKKLTTPKSTAVIIQLTPEAVQQKVSYKDAIGRATSSLKLDTVGLDFVRVRNTATGARIIEVPGADSADKADALAEKLKGLIGDVAVITRPVKTADLLISGLDESVTVEDIQRAVAAKGGCSMEQVKVGNIRTRPNGSGSSLIRCPVTVAQALITAERLLVGWSSAHVRALEPSPMRCFRCMGIGHTRALCPSPVDRSNLCFRCGKEGHKSNICTADPCCAVCSHARRPAGHVMGGRACVPVHVKGKVATQTLVSETTEGQMET